MNKQDVEAVFIAFNEFKLDLPDAVDKIWGLLEQAHDDGWDAGCDDLRAAWRSGMHGDAVNVTANPYRTN